MDDLAQFCCQNSRCSDFCRGRFSERKGTPLYRAHLPEDKVLSILEHVNEGCGVRKTARLVKVHPDTVSRYSRAAGEHSRAAHHELVAWPAPQNLVQPKWESLG